MPYQYTENCFLRQRNACSEYNQFLLGFYRAISPFSPIKFRLERSTAAVKWHILKTRRLQVPVSAGLGLVADNPQRRPAGQNALSIKYYVLFPSPRHPLPRRNLLFPSHVFRRYLNKIISIRPGECKPMAAVLGQTAQNLRFSIIISACRAYSFLDIANGRVLPCQLFPTDGRTP